MAPFAPRGHPIIVGAGVAGLMTALELAPRPVVVLSKAPLGAESSSLWAQGGMAAALGADDSPALHAADTIAAGDGLCDAAIGDRFVRAAPQAIAAGDGLCDAAIGDRFVRAAPQAIENLARLGVRFDRKPDGGFALGLEAAHSRSRIAHVGGDGAGRELMRALVAAACAAPSITVLEGFEARRLLVEDNAVSGLVAMGPSGPALFATDKVVIATGGIGGLYAESTNPLGSFAQGLALAARAGAALADMEFVQFHPTALDVPLRPMPLVSEAVRGEGARLIDVRGERFMAGVSGAELAPRDVVARAIWRLRQSGGRAFLDARVAIGDEFAARFPAITDACRAAGIDPAREPMPVRPAQHYHMGGIAVDPEGRSSVAGLWACGEAASTGLHGANRLASNSLAEAAVDAAIVARSIDGAKRLALAPPRSVSMPLAADPAAVRPILSHAAGVARDGETLSGAIGPLAEMAASNGSAADPAAVALMIVVAALRREHSLGAHYRADFPFAPKARERSRLTLDEAFVAALAYAPPHRIRRA